MAETMQALFGGAGPDWETRQVPVPTACPGQVLVRIRAASLNNADVKMLAAADPTTGTGEEYLAGFEFAGEIAAVGSGAQATGWGVGDRVMGISLGAFAGYVVVDHRHVMPVPAGVPDEEAAALPTGLLTEHGALAAAGFRPGQSVLITGGASGIGLIGIQIAKALGAATVIATTRTESRKELLTQAGADRAVATAEEDLTAAVLEATNGQGADVVLDHVGGQVFADCLPATRLEGHVVNIGRLDQAEATINLDHLSYRHLTVAGVSYSSSRPDELGQVIAALADQVLLAVGQGRIRPVLDTVLPFDRATEAAERLRSGRTHGKPVLTMP